MWEADGSPVLEALQRFAEALTTDRDGRSVNPPPRTSRQRRDAIARANRYLDAVGIRNVGSVARRLAAPLAVPADSRDRHAAESRTLSGQTAVPITAAPITAAPLPSTVDLDDVTIDVDIVEADARVGPAGVTSGCQ